MKTGRTWFRGIAAVLRIIRRAIAPEALSLAFNRAREDSAVTENSGCRAASRWRYCGDRSVLECSTRRPIAKAALLRTSGS